MIDRSPKRGQPEQLPDARATCTSAGIPRRVSVGSTDGAMVTVVVTVQRGHVWLSIVPPFTWEAIMQPGKVDELIHALALARDEAERERVSSGDRRQPVGTGTAAVLRPKQTTHDPGRPGATG